jgi:hypothetical protein
MPTEDPDLESKLATLRTMQHEGTSPRVAELVLVEWPAPDGPIYYATRMAFELLDNPALLARLDVDTEIQSRLGATVFLEVPQEAGIGDDRIDLDFWDGDNEMTRLMQTHGPGERVEVFYYFPDVDLLLSYWWGHLQPPTGVNKERFKTTAENGFRSGNLSLPKRAFFTGCQAVWAGFLSTQVEIDEGDCPYSRHLGSEPGEDSFGSDATWLQTLTPGADDWMAPAYDDSAWVAAVEQGGIGTAPWTNGAQYPAGVAAQWIWDHESAHSFDNSTIYFRKSFIAADTKALLSLTGDNSFVAYLNGVQIASGADWRQAYTALLTLELGATYVLAVKVVNGWAFDNFRTSPGGLLAIVAFGVSGVGFGNLDPATGQPYVSCPRNSFAVCIARLGDRLSYLAFDSILESHTVNETKGPNISVTSRGNTTNLDRALRAIAGKRHVADLDLLQFVVEPNTKHPDQGSVKCLFAVGEGNNKSVTNGKINGATIAPQHSNYRTGARRQPATSFSPNILNYSGTALFLGVAQGDFTKAGADDLKGEVDVEGLADVRVYSDESTFVETYTTERGWWLLHLLRNKRWGYGLDARRVHIPDFLEIADWYKQTVSVKDKDGTVFTGPRSQFNAELIGRTAQQQVEDLCRAGRLSLPFADKGKLRVVPLRRASELFSAAVFTDKAFFGALARSATTEEREEWFEALLAARDVSPEALLAECVARAQSLFNGDDYAARGRSDEEFISDCYLAFLRRDAAADPEGAAFWLNDLTTFSPPELARAHILAAFSESIEFVVDCTDSDVPTFSDRGDARNICVDGNQVSTWAYAELSDADLPNRVVVTFDDAAHQNTQVPLTFEDVEQQLRAGRSFGDTSRRSVEKKYTAFGVTDAGEAGRLGNLLLELGEFDEGGIKNNLRCSFTTWYLDTVGLHPYSIIKVDTAKLDVINGVRLSLELEPFRYFRVRSIKRMPDLKVEISCQAYPVDYYERLELLTDGPPIVPGGLPEDDPDDPDADGGRRLPARLSLSGVGHSDDQFFFQIQREAV